MPYVYLILTMLLTLLIIAIIPGVNPKDMPPHIRKQMEEGKLIIRRTKK